jgi:hypothetical protein
MSIEIRKMSWRLALWAIPAIVALCVGVLPRSGGANDFDFPSSADFKMLNGEVPG